MKRAVMFCSMVLCASGCDRPSASPAVQHVALAGELSTQSAFDTNCRGCHSQGAEGAALPLVNANYWKVATDATIIQAISHGQGRSMPAYLASEGGPFTAEQITSLVHGMRTLWGDGQPGGGGGISPVLTAGSASAGALVFSTACASCHAGQGTAGSVVDPMYLRMISDQGLWSAVVYGRSELGMPAWNQAMPGRPTGLSAQEVCDVVSWISSQRVSNEKVTK